MRNTAFSLLLIFCLFLGCRKETPQQGLKFQATTYFVIERPRGHIIPPRPHISPQELQHTAGFHKVQLDSPEFLNHLVETFTKEEVDGILATRGIFDDTTVTDIDLSELIHFSIEIPKSETSYPIIECTAYSNHSDKECVIVANKILDQYPVYFRAKSQETDSEATRLSKQLSALVAKEKRLDVLLLDLRRQQDQVSIGSLEKERSDTISMKDSLMKKIIEIESKRELLDNLPPTPGASLDMPK